MALVKSGLTAKIASFLGRGFVNFSFSNNYGGRVSGTQFANSHTE
jgi:hypothetical protein